MAQLIADDRWDIQGTPVQLPVTFPHARFSAAVFTAERAAVDKVVARTPLRAASVGRRTVSMLFCAHYDDWPLGRYDEVGVGVLVHGPDGGIGLFLSDLPVTQDRTREAGQDLWGLPKWLMEAELVFSHRSTEVRVADQGRPVLAARFGHGPLRVPFPIPAVLPIWAYLDHGVQAEKLLRGSMPNRMSGTRVGRGELLLELGDHPMASRMRDLGMTRRPLLTLSVDRLRGTIGTSQVVGGPQHLADLPA